MRDIIWDNIWPCEHQGIFLWVADGEVYGTDITKDEAQRKGQNCWQGKETLVKKIVPPLTLKECSLSQITHILLSAKPQHSHWSQNTLSKSIPWQNLTSGFTTQQVSQGCDSLGSGTITTPFPAALWRVKCKYGKTGLFFQGATCYSTHILSKMPRTAAKKTELFHWFSHPDLSAPTSIYPLVLPVARARTQASLPIQLLQGHPMLYQTFLLLSLRVFKSPRLILPLRDKWWL